MHITISDKVACRLATELASGKAARPSLKQDCTVRLSNRRDVILALMAKIKGLSEVTSDQRRLAIRALHEERARVESEICWRLQQYQGGRVKWRPTYC